MKTISFAVCGFGRIGKRHAHIIRGYEGVELTAVIDPKESLEEELTVSSLSDVSPAEGAGSADAVAAHASLDDFIASDGNRTDVINICTPNGLHAPLAVQALQAGYHVVIEKPMALSKQQCERVIDASLKAGRQVFVVKQNRYSPTSVWLKQVVDQGLLGDICLVQVNCYWNRDERYYSPDDWHGTMEMDGGVLFTQFSHFVDMMYWVFGDIRNIHARMENFNHGQMTEFEDSGLVQFDFERGGMGSINFSTATWDQNMESSITVIGEQGSLKVGGQYMNEVVHCHIKDYEMPELPETNPPNDYGPYKGSAANHHYVIQNVVETLGGTGSITANAMEGLKVVEIIEKIHQFRKVNHGN